MEQQSGFLDRIFHLKENHTSVRTEIMAGITTFMTMAYILAVNPGIMSAAGMDKGALLTATALAAFIGTILMALFANYPFALAPGMGLNAFFAFTVVGQMGYSWQTALAAVCLEGVIFIILSLTNVRDFQRDPHQPETGSVGRHRPVHCLHRTGFRQYHRRQSRYESFSFLL